MKIQSPGVLLARTKRARTHSPQSGLTLVELMIAMFIIAVGLGALFGVFTIAMYSNNKSSKDTSANMVAQTLLEAINATSAKAANAGVVTQLTLQDCAGNNFTASLLSGAGMPNLTATGNIDWTQAQAGITNANPGPGYAMTYTACGAGGTQVQYDVRWRIDPITWTGQAGPSSSVRMVSISAKQLSGTRVGGLQFAVPATLRGIGGGS